MRDYTHYVNSTVGFSKDVDAQLAMAAKLSSCEEFQKRCIMLMDEMYYKVRVSLRQAHCTGALVGFVNLGDINSHLITFEQSLQSQQSTTPSDSLATTMMVFVVQGLFSPLMSSFPVTMLLGSYYSIHFGRQCIEWDSRCDIRFSIGIHSMHHCLLTGSRSDI